MFRSPQPEQGDLRGPLADWGGLASLFAWLGVGLLGAIAILGAALGIIFGGLWWDSERIAFNRISRWWGRSVMRMFRGQVDLRGLEHLEGGPYIIAANHQSTVDLLVLFLLPASYRTVVKRSWFAPPFGLNIWTSGYVPTPKKGDPQGAKKVIAGCAAWLARGQHVLIFPEGTRARGWQVQRFKRGAFELSAMSGCRVLPVAIAGTNDISHPSSLRFCLRPLRVIVQVLPALPLVPEPKELQADCHDKLSSAVGALRRELKDVHGQGPSAPGPDVPV